MNVRTFEARTQSSQRATTQNAAAPVRHLHRERDFGVGYGNSSGYASNRRYTTDWAQPRFRFA